VQGQRSLSTLVVVALASAVVSTVAVADRASGFPGIIPRPVSKALAMFIEPGLTAWWFTIGAVFQSFPYNFTGYAATVAFNVALWLLAFALTRSMFRRLRRRANAGGSQ
jgi:hypothetical protein